MCRSSVTNSLAGVEDYIRLQFGDDCHVWSSALYDEVVPLGLSELRPPDPGSGPSSPTARSAGDEGQRHHRDRPPCR